MPNTPEVDVVKESAEPSVISDEEIDEAVAQIMEYTGVSDRSNGWAWRDLRDYGRDIESIIRSMLAGEFKAEAKD